MDRKLSKKTQRSLLMFAKTIAILHEVRHKCRVFLAHFSLQEKRHSASAFVEHSAFAEEHKFAGKIFSSSI
jgi:hypothetical protein